MTLGELSALPGESVERGTKEADIVSTRIAELLGVRTFHFRGFPEGYPRSSCLPEGFFEKLLLKGRHELRNRCLHVDYAEADGVQSAKSASSKCTFCTLEEKSVLDALGRNRS